MAVRNAVQKILDETASGISGLLIGTPDRISADKASGTFIKDAPHGAINFGLTDDFPNSPKLKFEYYVRINLNPNIDLATVKSYLGEGGTEVLIPYIISAKLPSVNIDTEILNQYNKKRVSQRRVQFQPVELSFYDLADSKTLRFWELYYEYYFKYGTPDKLQSNGSVRRKRSDAAFANDILASDNDVVSVDDFGYNLEAVQDNKYLIESIDIFQHRGPKYKQIHLVNPRISSFNHDELTYENSTDLVRMNMTLEYESVIYYDRPRQSVDYQVYEGVRGKFKETEAKAPRTKIIPGEKGLFDAIFDADLSLPVPDVPILGGIVKGINAGSSNVQQNLKSYVGDLPRQAARMAGDAIFTGEVTNPINAKKATQSILKQGAISGGSTTGRDFSSSAIGAGRVFVDTIRGG